jgi:hypothetical protein
MYIDYPMGGGEAPQRSYHTQRQVMSMKYRFPPGQTLDYRNAPLAT